MVSKRPILLHSWESNSRILILFRNLGLRRSIEEEKIDGASKSSPREVVRLHHNFHTVRVAVVNTVREGLVRRAFATFFIAEAALLNLRLRQGPLRHVAALVEVACLKVERMAAVEIAINWVTHVSSVDGSREVVVESKAMNALSQTVEVVVVGKCVDELDKLVLVNELAALGCEDNVSSRLTSDGEPERWVIAP